MRSGRNPAAAQGLAGFFGDDCMNAERNQPSPLVEVLNATLKAARALQNEALFAASQETNDADCAADLSAVISAASAANSTALFMASIATCRRLSPAADAMLHDKLCGSVRVHAHSTSHDPE